MAVTNSISPAFRQMISDFCAKRLAPVLPPRDVDRFIAYFFGLLDGSSPYWPFKAREVDWSAVAEAVQIEPERIDAARRDIQAGLDAIRRELGPRRP